MVQLWSRLIWSHHTHSASHCVGPCQRRSRPAYSASHCTNNLKSPWIQSLSSHKSRSQTPRVTVYKTKHTNQHKQSQVSIKTTKCQPAVRDTLVTVPHTPRVTVGVPDSWLARLKTNYLSNVTLVVSVKLTKWFNHSLVTPHILRESLCRSLSALVTAGKLRESLQSQSTGAAVTWLRSQLSGHDTAVMDHSISRKMRNKLVKQINGNGKNTLLISHWNLGSKKWQNKKNQIQALVDSDNPDVMFISEANLDELTPPHEKIDHRL